MSEPVRQSESQLFPEDIFEDADDAAPEVPDAARARRVALAALQRELSEFLDRARL
jgi:hypothetical protein